jgi:hypothetical protein
MSVFLTLHTMSKQIIHKFLEENEDDEIFIWAISTGKSSHQLAYYLNINFDWKLQLSENHFPVENKKMDKQYNFSFYGFDSPKLLTTFFIIKNKQHNTVVSSSLSKWDFFIIAKCREYFNHEDFVRRLREIDFIIALYPIEKSNFDNLSYLTLEKNEENKNRSYFRSGLQQQRDIT